MTDWSVIMPTAYSAPARKADSTAPQRRSQLLDSGRAVFSEHGFHSATVDEIAERAGVAKGTVYLYFRSKEELYFDIIEHDLEELYVETAKEMAKSETAFDRIRAYMRVRLEFAESRQDFLRLLVTESTGLMSRNEPFARLIGITYPERSCSQLKQVLEDAVRRGEVREVPVDSTARLLYELTAGMVRRRLRTKPEISMDDELNIALDVLWRGLGAAR